jgi:Holliday junction resolvasome RuvABC DNA-binding subunit
LFDVVVVVLRTNAIAFYWKECEKIGKKNANLLVLLLNGKAKQMEERKK